MVLLPLLRYTFFLPQRMCTTFLHYPRRVIAVMCGFGLVWFGFVNRRGLPPPGPCGESHDDSDSVKVSTELTEGEEEPSVIHCDANLSSVLAEGEESIVIHCDATLSSVLADGEEPSVVHCDATPSSTLAEGEEPCAIHCDDATPSSTLAEGEEEPSAIHCDDATPSAVAVGKRAADAGQDVGSVKRPRTEEDVEEEFESSEYVVDTTDEFYCEYDSTWETSRSHSRWTDRQRSSSNRKFGRFKNAARDMQNFRHNYPQEKTRYKQRNQKEDHMPNLEFYLGKRPSSPDGIYIDDFHNEWFQDYYKLENVHTFIQWLFPLQEPGVNYEAVELTKKEIKDFLKDEVAKANLLKSYKLMLDFYGIELSNEATGEVQRASNWEERFANLNRNTHNNQRISRILKCLGTLGYRHYQAPLVHFFLHETLVNEVLPSVKESVLNYFLFAVLDKGRRRSLIKFAYQSYKPREEFVWCPRKIQMVWSTDAQFPHSSQTSTVVYVDERVEKREFVSDANLYHIEESSSSREPEERYADMNEEPTNQSPPDPECSLPSQDDMPAELEETGEDVNPKPIQVPSADGSNDKMMKDEKVHGNL